MDTVLLAAPVPDRINPGTTSIKPLSPGTVTSISLSGEAVAPKRQVALTALVEELTTQIQISSSVVDDVPVEWIVFADPDAVPVILTPLPFVEPLHMTFVNVAMSLCLLRYEKISVGKMIWSLSPAVEAVDHDNVPLPLVVKAWPLVPSVVGNVYVAEPTCTTGAASLQIKTLLAI